MVNYDDLGVEKGQAHRWLVGHENILNVKSGGTNRAWNQEVPQVIIADTGIDAAPDPLFVYSLKPSLFRQKNSRWLLPDQ